MTSEFSLEELAAAVQEWSEKHRILPANGQAAEEITERTIRYYRTLGLLDAPSGNYTKTFSQKHKLQLIAIRAYQSQGLSLRKIRDELYGKSLDDLITLEKQATRRDRKTPLMAVPFLQPTSNESWSVSPLVANFLLVSRTNCQLPRAVIDQINKLISSAVLDSEPVADSKRN
jgi:DNA-binding transcriptional MerR regulator